MIFQNAL